MQTLLKLFGRSTFVAAVTAVVYVLVGAQTATPPRVKYDITNYKIDAQLAPSNNRLQNTVDVTFATQEDTRTLVFELNGSLKIESITRLNAVQNSTAAPTRAGRNQTAARPTPNANSNQNGAAVTFVQDQVGVSDIGPNVRVDLGDAVTKGTSVTLRFKYSGALLTPEGGPLTTKKLASVGNTVSYLTYASRWLPFHDYAVDRATADINISVPNGLTVAGFSDQAVTSTNAAGQTRFHFVNSKPALVGNFVAGKLSTKTLRFGNTELQFLVQPANEKRIAEYAEIIGKAADYYTTRFGAAENNGKLIVAQTDDETLDAYSGLGTLFLSTRYWENPPQNITERLQRETAYQWWGQTVGLKSFDDAWLSQGLAEYSAVELRETTLKGAQLDDLNRELLERSLTFEQTASLIRAPSTLDDQSAAYQYIMFYKGAEVYRLLRETVGADKFTQLLRNFVTQYRGKTASIDDFEKLSSQTAGTNMRYFFARWVEGTGVPEFSADYQIIRTRAGKFIARGTVKQNYDNLQLPVEVKLRSEGGDNGQMQTLRIGDKSEDFNIQSSGKPIEVIVDPNYKLLRIDDDLRVSSIARRGIEQYKEGNYAEAQQQFEAALKLNRSNSWVYYHLGLLFLEQRNYDLAVDNFKAALNGDLRPSWLGTWANIKMGNAYDAKGDRTRATAAYKRAEDTGSDYDNAQAVIKKYKAAPYDPKVKDNTASR